MRVLLVENDLAIASTLPTFLAGQILRTETTDAGEDALELLRHYEFDIVLLNLPLPDFKAIRLISRIRASGISTPLLALCSGRDRHGAPAAFAAGADDIVDQAIDPFELIARMRALVRRTRGQSQITLQVGGLTLDLDRREVTANGTAVALTGKEFELLQFLMMRQDLILTKGAILDQLYGGMDGPEAKIIDVFVCRIRKKLAGTGLDSMISTVWGRGYILSDTPNWSARLMSRSRQTDVHRAVMA